MSSGKQTRFTRHGGKILAVLAIISGASCAAYAQDAITGTIEIIRAGSVGKQLHVSDMIEIQNRSAPPRTLAGEHTFDVYLPAHAKISSVIAAGPGNVATMIPATPLPGDPGHYSVSFPLQPGATKFAFNYDFPYDGKAVFHIRHAYAVEQLAIMIPPTMHFSSASTGFKTLETGNKNYDVRAIAQLNAGPGPAFEISGSGSLPPSRSSIQPSIQPSIRPGENTAAAPVSSAPVVSTENASAANSEPASDRNPSSKASSLPAQIRPSPTPSWLILGILGLGLTATSAAAIRVGASKRAALRKMMRTSETRLNKTRSNQIYAPTLLLEGLKEELFQLESAKIRGTISHEEYDLTRSALEETVKRALRRAS